MLTFDQLVAADSIFNKVVDFENAIFQNVIFLVIFGKFCLQLFTQKHELETNATLFSVLNS